MQTLAARHDDGRVGVLVWNGTLDYSRVGGSELLGRQVTLTLQGLTADAYAVVHHRIDEAHSNVRAVRRELGAGADWPDGPAQWDALRAANGLAVLPEPDATAADGTVTTTFDLPMPGVSYLEFIPGDSPSGIPLSGR
ncbi:hypothetical protein [Streptantibioticus silvisoli]|uniref:Uncharacterized protein n=1 Tax=Streptantibioticus silvisoli TaxID=2705255 RepID=A0ABT6W638_9ACTN|nr:hypothetical protein [Streptantibioticus silvisoli]MDI5966144.1 hypothetical protein [Streptantibioticus silvisoli]